MPQRLIKSSKGRQRRRQQRTSAGDSVGKYASDAWSLAKRTAYGLNEIRKLINIETKIAEATGTSAIDTSGAVTSISLIAQGLDYQNRVGDSIKLQRVEFRARWSVGTGTATFVRTLLVRDLDNYGTKPGIGDVLQTVSVLSPKDYLNSDRFSILYDELGVLNQSESNSVTMFDSPHEGHIKYLGTTAADASSGKGSMYLMFLSNEAAGVTAPTVVLHSRLYYTDDQSFGDISTLTDQHLEAHRQEGVWIEPGMEWVAQKELSSLILGFDSPGPTHRPLAQRMVPCLHGSEQKRAICLLGPDKRENMFGRKSYRPFDTLHELSVELLTTPMHLTG